MSITIYESTKKGVPHGLDAENLQRRIEGKPLINQRVVVRAGGKQRG